MPAENYVMMQASRILQIIFDIYPSVDTVLEIILLSNGNRGMKHVEE